MNIVSQSTAACVVLPEITDEIWDMLHETGLITWNRDRGHPHWTQTAVDFASVLLLNLNLPNKTHNQEEKRHDT